VPRAPRFIKGVINLRGAIIPVVDMRLRFGLEEAAYTEKTCVVILLIDGMYIGAVVDEVRDVVTVGEERLRAPQRVPGGDGANGFVAAVGVLDSGVKQLIDARAVFALDA
jgi:purine-binding chemotaxis protein CheW